MKEIINTILAAATKAVDAVFPELPVFGEEVPESLPDRCFIVTVLEPDMRKAFGRRYEAKGIINIAYYSPPNALDRDREINEVYARLVTEIGLIQHDGITISLTKKQQREENGVLYTRCPFATQLYLKSDQTDLIAGVKINPEVTT